MKNYGLVLKKPEAEAYVLGAANQLPKIVLRSDSDWSPFLPTYEAQEDKYETYGCTVWGTQNIIETMLKFLEGVEYNFSERYNYILARVRPPGADPHIVAETIRKQGLIKNELLPLTDTYDEFIKPDPMTTNYLFQGSLFKYTLKHELVWGWNQKITEEERYKRIKEALQYSPLGVSVTAWHEQNGVYIDQGQPNTHWTMLYGIGEKGYLIFDSYDHSHKVLSFDHHIEVCKRFQLIPRLPPGGAILDTISRVLKLISDLLSEMKKKLGFHEIPMR